MQAIRSLSGWKTICR